MNLSSAVSSNLNNRVNKIHTSFPAKVVSVSVDGTIVDVQPMIRNKNRSYPILFDIPFLTPSIGKVGLFYKPKVDDEVLIHCSESDFDSWYKTSVESNESNMMRHDMSNAIAVCGFDSVKNKKVLNKTTDLLIQTEKATIEIDVNGEIILNDGKDYLVRFSDLSSILQSIIDKFNAHTHTIQVDPSTGAGSSTATLPFVVENLQSMKTDRIRV
jgi:hypothetical protein